MTDAVLIAIEQLVYFRSCGMTDHEIMSAVGRPYTQLMTGDEMIEEIFYAWQGLERTRA